MPVTKFQLVGDFDADHEALYTHFNGKEYYPGRIMPQAGGELEILIEKHNGVPFPVSRGVSRTVYLYERTSAEVRLAQRNLSVIRYMKRGSATFRQFHQLATVQQGDFVITRSDTPLSFTVYLDDHGVSEMIFMVVPTTMICHGSAEYKTSLDRLDGNSSHGRIASGLLQMLLDESGSLPLSSVARLTSNLLEEMRELVRVSDAFVAPMTIAERRFRDIQCYIELNYSNHSLSLEDVANRNNVSVRYICDLFKRRRTSFAKFMWGYRLRRVREWLLDERMAGCSIKELANRAGFKSAAHLSQVFRREFACSPKELRKSQGKDAPSCD